MICRADFIAVSIESFRFQRKRIYILTSTSLLSLISLFTSIFLFKLPTTTHDFPSSPSDKMKFSALYSIPLLKTSLYFSLILNNVHAMSPICKATPNDASWPSLSQWNTLNQTLSGHLLNPLPPASSCHVSYPGSNITCAEVTNSWSNMTFHQNNPVSTAWNNMNNDSCVPDPSTPCSGLGYPVYVVNASSVNDVKLAVDFARENNLRLNVKASGHDYLKR